MFKWIVQQIYIFNFSNIPHKENDISQIRNEKLENPLHALFRPDSACRQLSKIAETVSLLLNADCSPSDKNLWSKNTLDYIKYYSNIEKENKEKIISQLARDQVILRKIVIGDKNSSFVRRFMIK